MIDKAYLLYLVLMAVFGWLCYRFGFFAGQIEVLQDMWEWFMGRSLSEDDPAPEEDDR